MKTRPISIEPGSGTLHTGKLITRTNMAHGDYWKVLLVGNSKIFCVSKDGITEQAFWVRGDYEWLEVLPDDPPVHEEFFKKYGEAIFEAQHFEELGKHLMSAHKIEDLYKVFESRILAKLKSDNLI